MEVDINKRCDELVEMIRAQSGTRSVIHFPLIELTPDEKRSAELLMDRLQYRLDDVFPDADVAVTLDGHRRLNVSIRRAPN